MQRNVILAVAAMIVTIALVGVAAIPAGAYHVAGDNPDGDSSDQTVGVDTDADDGEANGHARSEQDGESVTASVAVDGDDETAEADARSEQDGESANGENGEDVDDPSDERDDETHIGSLVHVGTIEETDDERGEDQLTQINDGHERGEGSDENELVKIGEGEDDVSAELPPDRDDNTIEVGPFGR